MSESSNNSVINVDGTDVDVNPGYVIDSDGFAVPLEPVGIRNVDNNSYSTESLDSFYLTFLSKEQLETLKNRARSDLSD